MVVDDGGESHWVNAARELVKALILRALLESLPNRTLGHVRAFFHAKGRIVERSDGKKELISGQLVWLREMSLNEKPFDGVMAGIASAYLQKNEREFNSIVSMASVQLGFLDSRPLMAVLEKSSFKLSELKTGKTTVYLCLPASRMATHGKWFRMAVSQVMLMSENVEHKPNPPLLVLLEEFPVLGYLRSIEVAAGQIAGFGVKIFTVLQDLTQLQKFYKATWETFLGNSGIAVFFGNADVTTLEYVSKKLGRVGYGLQKKNRPSTSARMAGAQVIEEENRQSNLLEPHEVERLLAREHMRALAMYSGVSPLIIERVRYYDDPNLKGLL